MTPRKKSDLSMNRPKRITLRDVAELAGVSRATVSYVLNDVHNKISLREKTRKRVWEAVRELNYIPNLTAKSLITGKTGRVGVLCTKRNHVLMFDPYFSRVLEGLELGLKSKGYQMTITSCFGAQSDSDIQRTGMLLNSGNVDGVAVIGEAVKDMEDKTLPESVIRVYVMARPKDLKNHAYVGVDNKAGIIEIMRYLMNLGHRRIGYIGEPIEETPFSASIERFETYRSILEEAGIPYMENLVRTCDPWGEESYNMMISLLNERPRPTAVVCLNDKIAVLAMKAVRDYGLDVPADVSITGFGDIDLVAHIYPPLTTAKVFLEEMGKLAAEELTERIEGQIERSNKIDLLKPVLIIRQSCAPPRE